MSTKAGQSDSPLTLSALVAGFVLSIGLTLLAYGLVVGDWLLGRAAIIAVIALAVLQLVVQLVFFLHLGRESRPRWNMSAFYFMLIFLGIMVAGSLWIMHNLNYNMMDMTPHEKDIYMMQESDKGF